MRSTSPLLIGSALLTLAFTGCGDEDEPVIPEGTPTYHADVRAILDQNCVGCHAEGGVGPLRLDTFEFASQNAAAAVASVESGRMPPWQADPDCRHYVGERIVSDADKATLIEWAEAGAPEGDPTEATAAAIGAPAEDPTPPQVFSATHTAEMVVPYTPSEDSPDDYRCFVLDYEFPRDMFLTGSDVKPGTEALVHHVLLYSVPPESLEMVEAAEAETDEPGYPCFGGPVPNASDLSSNLAFTQLGGWAPGNDSTVLDDGRAVYVPGGSKIVMQVHYNTLGGELMSDETSFEMSLSEETPSHLVRTVPLAHTSIRISAGEANSTQQLMFRNYSTRALKLRGMTPHMHLLGREIRAKVVRESGAEECMIDIPQWDFNWQNAYTFRPGEEVVLEPGDAIELTCVYDNSESAQPIINGEQLEPREVTWGDGTLDEMCLLYLSYEEVWGGPPPTGCDDAQDCIAGCDAHDSECMLGCETTQPACGICRLESVLGCGGENCIAEYAPFFGCLQSCLASNALLGGSVLDCFEDACGAPTDNLVECLDEGLATGACDEMIQECGLTL